MPAASRQRRLADLKQNCEVTNGVISRLAYNKKYEK